MRVIRELRMCKYNLQYIHVYVCTYVCKYVCVLCAFALRIYSYTMLYYTLNKSNTILILHSYTNIHYYTHTYTTPYSAKEILAMQDSLQEIVQLVGKESLSEDQKLGIYCIEYSEYIMCVCRIQYVYVYIIQCIECIVYVWCICMMISLSMWRMFYARPLLIYQCTHKYTLTLKYIHPLIYIYYICSP